MAHGVNRVFALLLSMLLAFALAPGASADPASPVRLVSVCIECCAASPADSRCVTTSACAPASLAENAADETATKPLGAWCAGIVRPAYVPAVARVWAMAPASSSLGPPAYLSFGRLLL